MTSTRKIMYNSKSESSPEKTRHIDVPKLLVAFDTETTGLNQGRDDEPVSYGLVAYRDGKEIGRHHFVVAPSQQSTQGFTRSDGTQVKGSQDVHGWDSSDLAESFKEGLPKRDNHGNFLEPALHPAAGIHRFLSTLGNYQKQGAVFLGHNLSYDYDMLQRTHRRYANGFIGTDGRLTGGLPITSTGFDIDAARKRTIDTMWHDVASEPEINDPNDPRHVPDRTPRTRANKGRSLEACSLARGIIPGNHTSEADARAAAQLFFAQVNANRSRDGMPKLSKKQAKSIIDYENQSGPCTGDGDCNFCNHLDSLEEKYRPAGKGEKPSLEQKKNLKAIENARKMHQYIREQVYKGK